MLADVSFAVAPGEALILRGPNGAGKTTLLRTLAGLTPPLSGHVACAPDSIAYAGHADGLKSQLTVQENLTFWAGVFASGTITRAVDSFDLEGLLDRRAGDMSAGQKTPAVSGAPAGDGPPRLVPGRADRIAGHQERATLRRCGRTAPRGRRVGRDRHAYRPGSACRAQPRYLALHRQASARR
ncbi:ABC transporter involved in cytochrome c biogenesis, ATPase component CcmA [Roseibacterium elongatum DSM 19469]|uniref:ABC transporter involved in cytochrome c biogenesis, ATPase component CcmA n=1 Tax=Roseicyclus elongatus DSM 19469 TaxID=1294273 RepID=W8RWG9_9RHOB|nr:ABC transporter involved in cytochrome c biogenesis, ATPase component CcmA [Roseibacterium elongatum DSM 19469]